MVARGIALPLRALICALIVLIGSESICKAVKVKRICNDPLYLELYKEQSYSDHLVAILNNVQDKNTTFICGISVAKLLSFEHTLCKLKDVVERQFLWSTDNCSCGELSFNKGVVLLRQFYRIKHEECFFNDIQPIINIFMAVISAHSNEIAEEFKEVIENRLLGFNSKWNEKLLKWGANIGDISNDQIKKQSGLLSLCIELIPMRPTQRSLPESPYLLSTPFSYWKFFMESCRTFVKSRCSRLKNQPILLKVSHCFSKRSECDKLYEQASKCKKIDHERL